MSIIYDVIAAVTRVKRKNVARKSRITFFLIRELTGAKIIRFHGEKWTDIIFVYKSKKVNVMDKEKSDRMG